MMDDVSPSQGEYVIHVIGASTAAITCYPLEVIAEKRKKTKENEDSAGRQKQVWDHNRGGIGSNAGKFPSPNGLKSDEFTIVQALSQTE